MKGKIYGVGVGPGDPEQMTLKAVKTIRLCDKIGIPAATPENCTAYKIALGAVPEMAEKPVVAVTVPMTRDKDRLNAAYDEGAKKLAECLEQGDTIAFLNLGDPTIYGSYMDLHQRLQAKGYEAEIVNGIPSFCAVAAALDYPLGDGDEEIHILPGSSRAEAAVQYTGTKIVMKSGRRVGEVKKVLEESVNCGEVQAAAVINCGMEDEKIVRDIRSLEETAGYFTTILIRENKKGQSEE